METPELTEAFLVKIAGWEVIRQARAIAASDKVLSSEWIPPILRGVVQSEETSLRAGLVIKDTINIDNLCTCRASRQWGTICAHSVAVGLHVLKPIVPAGAPGPNPGNCNPTPTQKPGPRGVEMPVKRGRDPVQVRRSSDGIHCRLHIILPPNVGDAIRHGRVMVVLEGETPSARLPLASFAQRGSIRLDPEDEKVVATAELLAGGDTPGMMQLSLDQFLSFLPSLRLHSRITLGRQHEVKVQAEPFYPRINASLGSDGVISLNRLGEETVVQFVGERGDWLFFPVRKDARGDRIPAQFAPCGISAPFRSVLSVPLHIRRSDVPLFLSQEWPRWRSEHCVESDFKIEDFDFSPQKPRFEISLVGGLAHLTATIQGVYNGRAFTLGTNSSNDPVWLMDPDNGRRYSTRDLPAEHQALQRLRSAGFQSPDAQGKLHLAGQDRVVGFFAREFPRIEKEWTVHLEERLERSTRTQMERITPEFRALSSGEQWFDLEVSYSTASGERLSASDVQQLLRGGGNGRLRNGKVAVIDSGLMDEFSAVLHDVDPKQSSDENTTRYRMASTQSGFVAASLEQRGALIQGVEKLRSKMGSGEGSGVGECPDLGLLNSVLRPYQKQGVAWLRFLRANGFGGILADEMGLGKTLQVLAHLQALKGSLPVGDLKPSLVVCPTSLVFNWVNETRKFCPELRVLALEGGGRHRQFAEIPGQDLVITSYALVRRDLDRYLGAEFDSLILDEAQHIKNRQTQNAQAVKAVRAGHRLVLTGTPMENSVLDLWSIFDFLMPGYLGGAQDFRERYEVPIAKERDVSILQRLSRRIRPFLLRRMKRDVVKDLPEKIEQISYCELSEAQASVYQQILSATRREVLETSGGQGIARSRMLVLTALLRLRQVVCDLRLLKLEAPDAQDTTSLIEKKNSESGKLQLFHELLDEALDGGHRVLVFSQFTSMLKLLKAELVESETKFCYLDGSTTNRQQVVEQFQTQPDIPVFLISLKAGGVGLNLTGADTVIHFDPWWNPAVEDQATDRAHRIGQQRVVTSYKLIARGTIEEKILNLQRRKREILQATFTDEAGFGESLSWEEIQELLN